MKALIAVGVLVGALCVYGFVSMVSGAVSANGRVTAQLGSFALGGAK